MVGVVVSAGEPNSHDHDGSRQPRWWKEVRSARYALPSTGDRRGFERGCPDALYEEGSTGPGRRVRGAGAKSLHQFFTLLHQSSDLSHEAFFEISVSRSPHAVLD